jgi:hypothetical protein
LSSWTNNPKVGVLLQQWVINNLPNG